MGFLGYRSAAISHDHHIVSPVRRLPGGAFDHKVGGYTGQQKGVDATGGKYRRKVRAIESADPTLGHHRFSIPRRDGLVYLRSPGTLYESVGPDKSTKETAIRWAFRVARAKLYRDVDDLYT